MNNTNIRPPAVSGRFYPANEDKLESQIKEFMENVPPYEEKGELVAVMSPHAGYPFSGQVAAYSYKRLEDKSFDTVILIGPSHGYPLRNVSVYKTGAYKTPMGDVNIDEKLASEIFNQSQDIGFVKDAHRMEHCLEVQLPFLQYILDDFNIVPILISSTRYSEMLANAIVESINKFSNKKILIVNSTDLSHYPQYNNAVRSDKAVLEAVTSLDPNRFINTIQDCESNKKYTNLSTAACGKAGILTLIYYAKKIGAQAKVLHYANSGDSPYGEKNKVVGYGAMAFYKTNESKKKTEVEENEKSGSNPGDNENTKRQEAGTSMGLNEQEKEKLLHIARTTITKKLNDEPIPEFHTDSEILKEHRGAFVTLNKHGNLRGCIGTFVSNKPLYQIIQEMAISAALRDPRFPAVSKSEVDDLEIEISVLTPLKLIDDVEKIEVGTHGICIEKGYRRGVLLPQVATDQGWDRMTFLKHTCRKAGLPMDAWKDENTKIYIFSAQVFHEEG